MMQMKEFGSSNLIIFIFYTSYYAIQYSTYYKLLENDLQTPEDDVIDAACKQSSKCGAPDRPFPRNVIFEI